MFDVHLRLMLNFDFWVRGADLSERARGFCPRKLADALSYAKTSTRVLRPSGIWIVDPPLLLMKIWIREDGNMRLIYRECSRCEKQFWLYGGHVGDVSDILMPRAFIKMLTYN